jgi:eukaryotic-like serine/threonine-protein kinase
MLIGKNINGYIIKQFIGAGGMGEVYKAEHPHLNRTVAVKVLFQDSQKARFQNEAYIQASIRHENIAAMYEYTVFENKPCIIMEFIEGQTLDKYIQQKGKLKNDELLAIFKQIVGAIAHLHQNQIIHRDIKPSNIKIMNDGTIKLLDFGISKASYTPKLTQQGFVVGTTEYMAPEQFRNEVSLKSDVWALGVLLYEMATGYPPFEDQNYLFIRQKIEKGVYTNPSLLNPTLSSFTIEVLSKCLKLNPLQRITSTQLYSQLNKSKFTDNQWINIKNIDFNKNKNWIYGGIGIVFLMIVWMIIPSSNDETETTKKKIYVDVLNTNNAELVLPDGKVLKNEPFILEKEEGQKLEFQIRLGDFNRNYTIEKNYSDSTFHCDLDVF